MTRDWIDGRLDELCEIASQIFPATIPGTGEHDEWLIAGPGLMARATRSLQALRALKPGGFESDGYTVLRSLYEHVTRFAWLAADPMHHLPLWIKWDREERLKVDNDLREANDPRQLPAHIRAMFEAERDAIPGKLQALKQLAMEADNHWSTRLDAHAGRNERYGFTGLYRVLYRHSSAVAHGTAYGLGGVIHDGAPGLMTVGSERPFAHSPFSFGGVVYAMGLIIYAEAFAIGSMIEALDAVFAEHRDPR
jgi:Family of unknown function (DUF5677)